MRAGLSCPLHSLEVELLVPDTLDEDILPDCPGTQKLVSPSLLL